jgi:hypothetical protein
MGPGGRRRMADRRRKEMLHTDEIGASLHSCEGKISTVLYIVHRYI